MARSSENTGDALTYRILTIDEKVICRSVLRPGNDEKHPNHRANSDNQSPALASEVDHLDQSRLRLPTFNPNDILGRQFIKRLHGEPHKAEVIETLEEDKYLVRIGDGGREEILAYNEILNFLEEQEKDKEQDNSFIFEEIPDHRLNNKRKYEVLVKWQTGEETWEPLTWMVREDPITVAEYAQRNDLLKEPQWKRL